MANYRISLAIHKELSIFASAEEKYGALKQFLTTRKLVILFKSRIILSMNLFHANDQKVGRMNLFIMDVGIPVPLVG